MTFFGLEKILTKLTASQKRAEPKKNLCSCDLYETGPEGLNVVGFVPPDKIDSWPPGKATIDAWTINHKEIESLSPNHERWYTEIHTSDKLVGCYFKYNQLSFAEKKLIAYRIITLWGLGYLLPAK